MREQGHTKEVSERTGHEGEKAHEDGNGPGTWDGGEGEGNETDCLKDVSLALGVKTTGLHLNRGMATVLGSPD